MSHFAVYALTRNVGIDIVPPAPLCTRLQSRHSRREYSSPLPAERISDFAKFLQAGRVIAPPELREPRRNAERVYFGNGIFSVLLRESAR